MAEPKSLNKVVLNLLSARPIAFIPALGHLAKSANAGLFLSQILYWQGKGKNAKWSYHTIQQVYEETCLSRTEQDTAIKIWKKLGVLEQRNFQVPRKRHFRVDTKKLLELLKSAKSSAETDKLDCDSTHTNTENTTQTTEHRCGTYSTTARQNAREYDLSKVFFE